MPTKIEWTEEVWNMIGGCTKVSPGCGRCYALRDSWRIMHNPRRPDRYEDVCGIGPTGLQWTGRINLDYDALEKPLHWKKPRRVFVCSMSDLFHEDVPAEFTGRVFDVMGLDSRHTYQVLTKRPDRMRDFVTIYTDCLLERPLPNLWLGVTAENQKCADERGAYLLATPARKRFMSMEPMLGPIEIPVFLQGRIPPYCKPWNLEPGVRLDWIIIGCESGPGRRPMELEWAVDLVRQCKAASVACFVKQIPVNGKVSHDPAEWPEELQVREYPKDVP